jgi:catechol 2,3-dioxygenase
MRPGHVQIRVMDLAAAVSHYRDVVGLIETHRDAKGRVYLKGWTESDKFSVVLREDDRPGLDFTGFKVASDAVLDSLAAELKAYGCKVEEIPAGELDDCGRRIRFDSPTRHFFELYAEKTRTGKYGVTQVNPEAWPRDLKGMKVSRLDHVLLYGGDLDGTLELFTSVLGFELTEQVMDGNLRVAQFLTCSMKEHDIAFIRHAEDGKLHHVAFNLDTWDEVLRAADIISMEDVPLDMGPTRHGLTHGQVI